MQPEHMTLKHYQYKRKKDLEKHDIGAFWWKVVLWVETFIIALLVQQCSREEAFLAMQLVKSWVVLKSHLSIPVWCPAHLGFFCPFWPQQQFWETEIYWEDSPQRRRKGSKARHTLIYATCFIPLVQIFKTCSRKQKAEIRKPENVQMYLAQHFEPHLSKGWFSQTGLPGVYQQYRSIEVRHFCRSYSVWYRSKAS